MAVPIMTADQLNAELDQQQGNSVNGVPSLTADQLNNEVQKNINVPQVGGLEALARGVGQGLTFDKLAQVLKGASMAGMAESGMLTDPKYNINQQQMLDIANKEGIDQQAANDAAKAQHPILTGTGDVIGSIPAYALTGDLAGVAKAPTLLGKMALGGAAAAPIGALHGVLNAQGSPEDQAKQVALEALMSGAGGSVGEAVGAGAGVVGQYLKSKAGPVAAKALGALQPQINKMGQAKINETGQWALDNGIIGPFTSISKMIKNNGNVGIDANKDLDFHYNLLSGFDAGAPQSSLIARIDELQKNLPPGSIIPGMQANAESARLDKIKDLITEYGDKQGIKKDPITDEEFDDPFLTTDTIRALRQELDKNTKFNVNLDTTGTAEGVRNASKNSRNAMNDAILDSATEIGHDITGGVDPEILADAIRNGNKNVSTSINTAELLKQRMKRATTNNKIGLGTQAIIGGVLSGLGGSSDNPYVKYPSLVGATLIGGKMGYDKYGAQMGASLLNSAGNQLIKGTGTSLFPSLTGYLAGDEDGSQKDDDEEQAKSNYAKHFPQ